MPLHPLGLDYTYFVYGLAFVLVAAVCFLLPRNSGRGLSWVWFGLFGAVHGVHEWIDMLTFSLGDRPAFTVPQVAFMTLSFVFLLEFGRSGLRTLRGTGPGRLIHVPLLLLAAAGAFAGVAGYNAAARYALGLTGGLWAAWALVQAARSEPHAARTLLLLAAATALYAVATGCVGPSAPFPPASIINQDTFLAATGWPIQAVRAALVVLMAATLWAYAVQTRIRDLPERARTRFAMSGLWLAVLLVAVLAAGWKLVGFAGAWSDDNVRELLEARVSAGAAGIDPARVMDLNRTAPDHENANYRHLLRGLDVLYDTQPRALALRLLVRSDGRILEAVAARSPDAGRFAAALNPDRPQGALLRIFETGIASTAGPYGDVRGQIVSGFAAVRDPKTDRVEAVLALDIDAQDWRRPVALYRLWTIFITLLLALLVIALVVFRERMLESSDLTAESERQLAVAQRIAQVGSWTYDSRAKRTTWSDEMYRLFGRDPDLGPPSFPDDYQPLLHPDDWPRFEATLRRGTETAEPRTEVFRIVLPGGGLRYVVSRFNARRGPDGRILAMAGTVQDVTDQTLLEERLRQNEERYRIVASYTLDWEYWRDLHGTFRYLSPSCESVTGYRPEEFVADPDLLVRIIHPEDREAIVRHMREAVHSHEACELDFRIVRRDGEVRWLTHVCRAVYGDDGKHLGRRISNRDVTEKKQAAQQLLELSLLDELTGLNNRRGFVTLATQQLIVADRLKQRLILVYADLDDLKQINDDLGHKEGDRAIMDVADALRNSFRSADIVARIGGDEFVGLAIESSDNAADSILARLKENLNARNLRGDRRSRLSLSVGVAYYEVDAPCTLDELLERGDAQMYRQKQERQAKRAP